MMLRKIKILLMAFSLLLTTSISFADSSIAFKTIDGLPMQVTAGQSLSLHYQLVNLSGNPGYPVYYKMSVAVIPYALIDQVKTNCNWSGSVTTVPLVPNGGACDLYINFSVPTNATPGSYSATIAQATYEFAIPLVLQTTIIAATPPAPTPSTTVNATVTITGDLATLGGQIVPVLLTSTTSYPAVNISADNTAHAFGAINPDSYSVAPPSVMVGSDKYDLKSSGPFIIDSTHTNITLEYDKKTAPPVPPTTVNATVTITGDLATLGGQSVSVILSGATIYPAVTILADNLAHAFGTINIGSYLAFPATVAVGSDTYNLTSAGPFTVDGTHTSITLEYNKIAPPIPGSAPAGWDPDKITMSTLFDNDPDTLKMFASRPVASVFTYAGQSGGGDPGVIVPFANSKMPHTIGQIITTGYQTMPVFVVYTANASGGDRVTAFNDMEDPDTLEMHYETLINYAIGLEAYYKNPTNSIRSTIILNPDLIGTLVKNFGITYNTELTIDVTPQLLTAIHNRGQDNLANVPLSYFVGSDGKSTIANYMQSIEWILGVFAPDVPYGWEDADWAPLTEGVLANNWLHKANQMSDADKAVHISTAATTEAEFLKDLGIFSPIPISLKDGSQYTTNATFLAFDKYGANPIFYQSAYTPPSCPSGDFSNINAGYLFNSLDWENYLSYTSQVAKQISMPLMLFQMPGAHLPELKEKCPYTQLATAPDYFLGPSSAGLDLSTFNNIPGIIGSNYFTTATSSGAYLQLSADWQSHLAELRQDGVFAILWGGGGFATGILPEGTTFDDGGWLYNRVTNSDSQYVVRPQQAPAPDVSKLPSYPCNTGDGSATCPTENQYAYTTIDRMTVRDGTAKSGMCAFQCIQQNWCNSPTNSYEPPADASGGTGALWRGAWQQVATAQCALTG